ncbi:hypothetical protein WN943_001007 [Citrus x changshan-huyou]
MAEKPAQTGPGACGPGSMEKADPNIDFQCPTGSGQRSDHNTKNPEPVPAFLLKSAPSSVSPPPIFTNGDVALTAPLPPRTAKHSHQSVIELFTVWSSSQRQPPRDGVRHHSWSHTLTPLFCHHISCNPAITATTHESLSDNIDINSSNAPNLCWNVEDSNDNEVEEISLFDPNVLQSLIARMVVMHELPLKFVEYKGFREMMALANPVVKPMSRNTLKNEILKLYHIEKVKTLHMLEKNHGRVAITTDL